VVSHTNIKKPSSKVPSLETNVFPSLIDSDELMLSKAVENFNRKISALAPVNISARIILMMSNV
jgi:hypothetical protein